MDGNCSTDSIRSLASHWSLAGDDKLLVILQNMHKKIVSKCQEVNAKLNVMTFALDDASISLQNVNNKFMALSNSQFIESRVYDDDEVEEVVPEPIPTKEIPKNPPPSQADMVKKSLSILENMHEVVTILRDSDTESDSEDEDIARIVLKPKDLYKDRPLPHIIGSEAWKNKWHAGLVVEDSDTDSCTSKPDGLTPEYSESEDEVPMSTQTPDPPVYEKEHVIVREETPPEAKMTPSDIAAELARRLAAQAPQIPEPEDVYTPPRPAMKTVYRPQQPATGVVFSDEPPPLEEYDSESSQEDIFAELHKSQLYSRNEGVKDSPADDLFGVTSRSGEDIFGDTNNKVSLPRPDPGPSSAQSDRNAQAVERRNSGDEVTDKGSKKPVGGISVFGSSKGADSIGAAILKRNIRKPASSSDEDDSTEQPPPRVSTTDQTDSVKKEKDIFDHLFAKPKVAKDSKGNIEKNYTEKVKEDNTREEKAKGIVDLFSDNIFDDIDDIFSSNIVKMPKSDLKVNKQPIFDGDFDFFADVADVATSKVTSKAIGGEKKGLFDSDDDLFNEKSPRTVNVSTKIVSQNNRVDAVNIVDSKRSETREEDVFNSTRSSKLSDTRDSGSVKTSTKIIKETKSIFDSDSDSDIFSSISISKPKVAGTSKITKTLEQNIKASISDKVSKINNNIDENTSRVEPMACVTETEKVVKIGDQIKKIRSPSLFDEDDDLFNAGHNTSTSNKKGDDKNERVPGNEEITASEKITEDTPKHGINKKPSEIPDKHSDNLSNKNIGEAVLNTKQTVTVISDNKTTEKVHIICEDEQTNTQSTNNTDNEKEALFPQESNTIPNKDILSEILSEPPAFEKPKEPKKSKNVNALFDDDSDDEALFFRKSDVIEEVPDNFSSKVNQDAVFGLFQDEPPAIDVDFGSQDDNPDSDTDIFSPYPNLHIHNNLLDKTDLDAIIIPESPSYSPDLTRSDDFTKHKDIFSSIDSENIFTPTNETVIATDRPNVNEGNDIDDLFNTPKGNLGRPERAPDIVDEGLFSPTTNLDIPAGRNLFGPITNKLNDTPEENLSEDNTGKPVDPDDLFSYLKNPPKSSPKVPPVVPDFDDSDEELFNPTTMIKSQYSILTSSRPGFDLFDTAKDSNSEISNKEETDVNKSKLDDSLGSVIKHDKDHENIVKTVNSQQKYNADTLENDKTKSQSKIEASTNTVQLKTDLEQKTETKDNVDHELNKESDMKRIGKLKGIDLNINVATLLPGASPKKQNKLQTTITTKQNNEKVIVEIEVDDPEKTEPTMTKSISFEGGPNSDVLDNKLSKERAKIQIKRRPSTRKARREAVRKSVIDLEDSTDNSSSIDDPPKNKTDSKNKTNLSEQLEKGDTGKNIEVPQTVKKTTDLDKKQETKVTKVVYILNDEDIFNTKSRTTNLDNNYKSKNVDTLEGITEGLDFTDGIKTVGKVYRDVSTDNPKSTKTKKNEENEKKATKSSLFDEASDDDELFNKSKKTVQKPSIFDSDSEEDLFTGRRKEIDKKIDVKQSLFGDEEGGDDLFAIKNKNTDTKMNIPKPHASKELPKSTEPVFDDPLSMLEFDE